MGKHAPNSFQRYISIHETAMARFRRDGFVESDTLTVSPADGNTIRLNGDIFCQGGIIIRVKKTLAIHSHHVASTVAVDEDSDAMIQTVGYRYHVEQAGRPIVRYDNTHQYTGMPSENHRHEYEWPGGRQKAPTHTGEDWPTLAEVIEEARRWFWGHSGELAGR